MVQGPSINPKQYASKPDDFIIGSIFPNLTNAKTKTQRGGGNNMILSPIINPTATKAGSFMIHTSESTSRMIPE